MVGMVTTRAELEGIGFEVFVRFADLPTVPVPASAGVYAVLRCTDDPPTFLSGSPAGAVRGDPSVPPEALEDVWVEGVEVVYFGKASRLRDRLDQYRRHGLGGRARHWGGRYIWQLADADQLLVAWRTTPGEDPAAAESALIREFVAATGQRPFANRNLGKRPVT